MKRIIAVILSLLSCTALFTGCGSSESRINVLSREDGSGTRSAFVELLGIEQDGIDMTTDSAEITNSTSVMITTVVGNPQAIGYISMGSLSDEVKALQINGTAANARNVKNGSYPISRPFNIATLGEPSEAAQEFIDFILSDIGQTVVEDGGYIGEGSRGTFETTKPGGKVVVGGSSSVTPIMEKLKEAYLLLNPNAEIDIQQSDSSTGMTSTLDGAYDIGMASRDLKDSELEAGLVPTTIAMDGIAVIVNKSNPIESLSAEQIMRIYTGEVAFWDELQ